MLDLKLSPTLDIFGIEHQSITNTKLNKSEAKELSNSVVVSIDNAIITELDIYKEKNFIKFINKNELTSNKELLKKTVINNLIERKIKEIETNTLNIEVSEKEVENDVNNYLIEAKLNNDLLDLFYNNNDKI